jgi:predicted transcriptional regulator
MAEAAPNAARGVARLHAAWREALERLSDFSRSLSGDGMDSGLPGRSDPGLDVANPWIPELEEAAAAVAEELMPRDDPAQALKAQLKTTHRVEARILPGHVMPVEQARYDRHSQRLFISEGVPLIERPFLMARQLALLGHRELLDRLTADAALQDAEAARLHRLGLAQRLAAAVLAPAERLANAARELGADPIRLSQRFMLSPLRIMLRLAALGAGFPDFPPAFLILIDASGGVLARIPGAGFPFPRFGPLCGRLPLFDVPRTDEVVRAELALPDGDSFLAIAVAEHGERRPDLPPPRRVAMLAWRRGDAGDLAKGWPALPARPIGVACRLCERLDCAHRIQPPVTRPAAFQDFVVGSASLY